MEWGDKSLQSILGLFLIGPCIQEKRQGERRQGERRHRPIQSVESVVLLPSGERILDRRKGERRMWDRRGMGWLTHSSPP
ncbi:MAG: hypothetical protein HY998_07290 [candidate division NC10 bacterium]|nr:hypothetical protein [candidate division NC10 bacterium]